MAILVGDCNFEGHPVAMALASGGFNLDSSILPAQVTSNQPANLRVVFDYLSSHFGENGTYYVWNFLYRKYEYSIGLDSIHLLASNDIAHGVINDFGKASPGTLIWESGNLTIEDLLGHPISQSGYYTITFELAFNWFINWDRYYCVPIIPGCLWVYDWSGSCRPGSIDKCIIESLVYTFYVEVPVPPPPPPPDLHFYLDLCDVDKSTVTPTEQFHVKLAIENFNETSGPFYVGCFCKGAYQQLWKGTITYPNIPTKTLTVTANQLAQQPITKSQYLAFTFTVSNTPGNPPPDATIDNPHGITGRWTPAAIYVNVETPPPETANLSGRVTDKSDGIIAGALVTVGDYSDYTDASGYYSLQGLAVGTYTIRVTATGYDDVNKVKTLVEGNNTQNIVMTAGEPGETSWSKILGGAAVIAGVAIILSQAKKGGKNGKR